jgi:hypothetical protein
MPLSLFPVILSYSEGSPAMHYRFACLGYFAITQDDGVVVKYLVP